MLPCRTLHPISSPTRRILHFVISACAIFRMFWAPSFALGLPMALVAEGKVSSVKSAQKSAQTAAAYERGSAGFSIRYANQESDLTVNPMFAMPGTPIQLEALPGPYAGRFSIEVSEGEIENLARQKYSWTWTPPKTPGFYRAKVTDAVSGDRIDLHLFVMVPTKEMRDGKLNGYRIGAYPTPSAGALPIYNHPTGFIEVTQETKNVRVSPNFTLGQFLCKQAGGWPKYVLLQEELVFKLEEALERINAAGIPARTFQVMSGYRTPYYNAGLGNVQFSAHVYGGAADVFIDENGDGRMDDINGDGKSDLRDVSLLYRVMETGLANTPGGTFTGGLGNYKSTHAHGGFVHIDVRGKAARWGEVIQVAIPTPKRKENGVATAAGGEIVPVDLRR